MPRGAIPGAEVVGGANALCCAVCGVVVTVIAQHMLLRSRLGTR